MVRVSPTRRGDIIRDQTSKRFNLFIDGVWMGDYPSIAAAKRAAKSDYGRPSDFFR